MSRFRRAPCLLAPGYPPFILPTQWGIPRPSGAKPPERHATESTVRRGARGLWKVGDSLFEGPFPSNGTVPSPLPLNQPPGKRAGGSLSSLSWFEAWQGRTHLAAGGPGICRVIKRLLRSAEPRRDRRTFSPLKGGRSAIDGHVVRFPHRSQLPAARRTSFYTYPRIGWSRDAERSISLRRAKKHPAVGSLPSTQTSLLPRHIQKLRQ